MSTLRPEPPQPPPASWRFIDELQSPLWQPFSWRRLTRKPREAALADGVTMVATFPDEHGHLHTAYDDLERFFDAAGMPRSGPYRLTFAVDPSLASETHRITVSRHECSVSAADTQGIRRAVYFLEDEMLRAGGPFLPLGTIERRPAVKTRISRCFFGPIHRPPHNIDELTNDVDYYPDEYLNRLAHEGVNGLWLTVYFADICRQSVIPEYGRDAARHIGKLRRTVEQCRRYGIRIYLYANEPAPIRVDSEVARAHPELLGHGYGEWRYFCTSSPTAERYLEEAMHNLFADVPGLGGIVNISIGEHGCHCYSGWLHGNNCPRCSTRDPHDVLRDTLAAMERGMHAASPGAELISWPYGQYVLWGDEQTVESAAKLPPNVILQHNFESSGVGQQCGRDHKILDYWLSWVGPAQLFTDCARAASASGNRVSAKIQAGCSHEVATVPYVPVPGHLYRKYQAMRDLNVSSVMQCWYFGNYPGIMTRAAGELSFDPLPANERAFLTWLARRDWGGDARQVVRAWEHFQEGYSHFPLNHVFGWYGPLHDAPTWPLHLEPADLPIAPSWQAAWRDTQQPIAASGDRIGETFTYSHSLPEILSLCRAMAREWSRGVAILRRLLPKHHGNADRVRDIGVATALGIQMESTYNMLRFYSLRERLPYLPRARQLRSLHQMRAIVTREIDLDTELMALAEADSRLGYHSEAEGYKYFSAKLAWRRQQLQDLLAADFPRVEAQVRAREPLWPHYTGREPQGPAYHCRRVATAPALDGDANGPVWAELPEMELAALDFEPSGGKGASSDPFTPGPRTAPAEPVLPVGSPASRAFWKACYDDQALYLAVRCLDARKAPAPDDSADDPYGPESVSLLIEPRRLWPNQRYEVAPVGSHRLVRYPLPADDRWPVVATQDECGWSFTAAIPFAYLRDDQSVSRPMRLDVEWRRRRAEGVYTYSWMQRHPLVNRLVFGRANPADLGWLLFDH